MNKFVIFLTVSALMVFSVISYSSGNKITIYLDGSPIRFYEQKPYVSKNGRTLVPIRFFANYLGAEVEWENGKKILIVTKGNKKITMKVNNNIANVNVLTKADTQIALDSDVVIVNKRAYVPLRFIAENLGYKVDMDEKIKDTIKITSRTLS